MIDPTNRGERPRFKLGGRRALIFIDRSCKHENLSLLGRVTLTVHGDGKTRQTHLNDQCDFYWQPRRADAGHWELREDGYSGYMQFIAHRGLGLGSHHFEGTIRFRKKVLLRFTSTVTLALR